MQNVILQTDLNESLLIEQLKNKKNQLDQEFAFIQNKINRFEDFLRSHLMDDIILSQELYALYKSQKKAKKEKRKLQHKKQFDQQELPQVVKKTTKQIAALTHKKKLYREAMAKVHPDRFYQMDETLEIANELSLALIKIYQEGTLEELEIFHQQIVNADSIHQIAFNQANLLNSVASLKEQIATLELQISKLKQSQLWEVLITYPNPHSFLEELKDYYKDRIFKLKKRTRTQ